MWCALGNLGKKMGKFVAGSKWSPLQIPGAFRGWLSALRKPTGNCGDTTAKKRKQAADMRVRPVSDFSQQWPPGS
jgi:hypothetical protein